MSRLTLATVWPVAWSRRLADPVAVVRLELVGGFW